MLLFFEPSAPQGNASQLSTRLVNRSLMIITSLAPPFFSARGLGNQPMKSANQFERIVLCTISFLSFIKTADAAVDVLGVMAAELDRSIEVLSKESPPLYFLSYEITQQDRASVVASFGAVSQNSRSAECSLFVAPGVDSCQPQSRYVASGNPVADLHPRHDIHRALQQCAEEIADRTFRSSWYCSGHYNTQSLPITLSISPSIRQTTVILDPFLNSANTPSYLAGKNA